MAINGLFVRTDPQRRRYGVALLVGVLSGIISAFVKWGAEVPLPPRTFSGGRDEFNPPYIFLRDYLGIDPTQTVYTFSEHNYQPGDGDAYHLLTGFCDRVLCCRGNFSESEIMAGDISRAYCDSGSPRYILPGAEFNAAAHSIAF